MAVNDDRGQTANTGNTANNRKKAKKPEKNPPLYVYKDTICTKKEMRNYVWSRFNGSDYSQWSDPSPDFNEYMSAGQKANAIYSAWKETNISYTSSKNELFFGTHKTEEIHQVRHSGLGGEGDTAVITARKLVADLFEAIGDACKNVWKKFVDEINSSLDEEDRERLVRFKNEKLAVIPQRLSEKAYYFKLTAILIAIAVLCIFLIYKIVFVIDNVNVSGSEIYTESEIAESANFEEGDNLYSFDSSETQDSVMFGCPYVESVTVECGIPRTVSLEVTEESGVYYADIWGDITILSSGLRVLGTVSGVEEAQEMGMIRLVIPELVSSVAGKLVEFREQTNERRVRDAITKISKSSLYNEGLVTSISISDGFSVVLIVNGNCRMVFDSTDNFEYKLTLAYATYMTESFDRDTPSKVDMKPENPVVESNPLFTFD